MPSEWFLSSGHFKKYRKLQCVLVKVDQSYLHKINELQIVVHYVEGGKMFFNNTFESNAVTDKNNFFNTGNYPVAFKIVKFDFLLETDLLF